MPSLTLVQKRAILEAHENLNKVSAAYRAADNAYGRSLGYMGREGPNTARLAREIAPLVTKWKNARARLTSLLKKNGLGGSSPNYSRMRQSVRSAKRNAAARKIQAAWRHTRSPKTTKRIPRTNM